MRKINTLLSIYGESHTTALNQKLHFLCVPAIFFSLLGLLYAVPVHPLFTDNLPPGVAEHVNLASALVVLGSLYYLSLSLKFAGCMLIASLVALALIQAIERYVPFPLWWVMISIFIIAWIGQFIGHKHEGKKPSFFDDLKFLMIGPLWTLSHLFDRFGIRY